MNRSKRTMRVWTLPLREGTELAEARVPWPLNQREFEALMNYFRVAWKPCVEDEEAPEGAPSSAVSWPLAQDGARDTILRWHEWAWPDFTPDFTIARGEDYRA